MELLASIAIIAGAVGLFLLVVFRRGWAQLLCVGMFLLGVAGVTVGFIVAIALFWLLAIMGFVEFFESAKSTVSNFAGNQREVHHYHRVTIDSAGNLVESTDYTERH